MLFAQGLVVLFMTYAIVGLVFAVVFVWRGIGRIDPGAREAGLGFRILMIPASAALWPLLLKRWMK